MHVSGIMAVLTPSTMLPELTLLQGQEGEGSEVINLCEKIPFNPPKKQAGLPAEAGQGKPPLPGWSEKVAHGILTGGFVSQRAVQKKKRTKKRTLCCWTTRWQC